MRFTTPSLVEMVCWNLKQSDRQRSSDRSDINSLFNGAPPFSEEERNENKFDTNVNFLEATKIAHDARRQFVNAFLKAGRFFSVTLDYGPAYKRHEWSAIITKEINRQLKRSLKYVEVQRSKFANVVLHGIGPTAWEDDESVVPYAVGVDDVLIPGRTLLSMENLEFYAVYRQYTPAWLWKITHKPEVDRAWNIPLVESLVEACNKAVLTNQYAHNLQWNEMFSPEKITERMKEDAGFYSSDIVPTINLWDFYYLDDYGKREGWRRKIIVDFPSGLNVPISKGKGKFVYDSGNERVYADKLEHMIHWQFGDASAVAPFRYHSVRSLGYMLYAICHMQNRLRCRFNDYVFRQLLELFRVRNSEDVHRLQMIDLQNLGVLPEGVEWVKAADRYAVNQQLVETAMAQNRQSMSDNSASYTQDYDFAQGKTPETATATMAKVNAATAMVSSMLTQAYCYETFQYLELCRRFCMANSKDKMARDFRNNVLKQGVPEEALDVNMWTVEPERVLGAGNKMLEIMQADALMQMRPFLDPESQRDVDRINVLAKTDNPDLAERLVPTERRISPAVYDADVEIAPLMLGFDVGMKEGVNHIDYVETMLNKMETVIELATQRGPQQQELAGLKNVANHVSKHIEIIGQNPQEAQRVKAYNDILGKLMNQVTSLMEQFMEAQGQQVGGEAGLAGEDKAKIAGMMIQAQTKAELAKMSHQQRTAQRQAQWEMEQRRKQIEHDQKLVQDAQKQRVDIAATDMKTAAEIRREGLQNTQKMAGKNE